jgi:hypothetical protein
MKTQIFHHAKIYNLQNNPLKRNQNLSRHYNSNSRFNTSQNIIFQKSSYKNRPIISGRPEGSKHNLKFQSAMWHHFKHFQSKIFFFLVAFLSQHLNYFVIIIWKILNYIGSKNINTFHNIGR